MIKLLEDKNKTTNFGLVLSLGGLVLFLVLHVAVTYYHSANFGVLSRVVPDKESPLFLIYPFVIDVPVLVTGTVLITIGFLGLSSELKSKVRQANIGFALLSCFGNYVSVYSLGENITISSSGIMSPATIWILSRLPNVMYSFAGIISPLSLWILSEILFAFVSNIVLKNDIIQSIDELKETEARLKKSVNDLPQMQNTLSKAKQDFNKFTEYAAKEKEQVIKAIETLESKRQKLEDGNQTLHDEYKILGEKKSQLNRDVENIKSWFTSMAASTSKREDHKAKTEERRTALLKEFAKTKSINLTSVKNDDVVFQKRIKANGSF